MPSDMPHFKLRLPQELLDRVRAVAEKHRRTATSVIVELIEKGVRDLEADEALAGMGDASLKKERGSTYAGMTDEQFAEMLEMLEYVRDLRRPAFARKAKKAPPKRR